MNTIYLTLSLLLGSIALQGQAGDDDRQAYVDRYSQLAIQEMERTGVPASIKLAQAVLESRWGTSELARKANNHFGIKCGGRWSGKTYYKKDDDYVLGELVPSCFRVYSSTHASFVAHSNFLISNARYAGLFALNPTNYKAWARGLKSAGYATAKDYHKTLIRVIEDMELYRYDYMQAEAPELVVIDPKVDNTRPTTGNRPNTVPIPAPNGPMPPKEGAAMRPLQVLSNNDVKYVVPNEGQTLELLAKDLKIPVKWLLSYNEHIEEATEQLDAGEWVYIQAKRKNYRGRKRWHDISAEDSMFSLSQRYGISLHHLYNRNQMIPGTEPAVGAQIKLRGGMVKTAPPLRPIKGLGVREGTVPQTSARPKPVSNTKPAKVNFSKLLKEDGAQTVQKQDGNVSSGAVFHKVLSGENLDSIAKRYQVSVKQLKIWNALDDKAQVEPGQRLRVQ